MGSYAGGSNRGYYLVANISQGTQDPGNNRTYCYASIDLRCTNQYFQGYSASGSFQVNGGVVQYYGGNYSLPGYNSSINIGYWEGWIGHDANGNGTISVWSDFDTASSPSYLPDYLAVGASEGLPNYDRKPSAPSSVTAVVNVDKTITVTVNGVSSPAGAATYYVSYSQNGGGFTGTQSGSSNVFTFSGLTPGSNYVFRAYATNSDGTGSSVDSSSTFLPSGGKRYDGTNFVSTQTAKRYDGTTWQTITTAKRYDGTTWQNLS